LAFALVDGGEICVGQNTRHTGRDLNPGFHKYIKKVTTYWTEWDTRED